LSTLLAADELHEVEHEVHVFNTGLCHSPEVLDDILLGLKPEALVSHEDCSKHLTKRCLTLMRDAAFRMIEARLQPVLRG
jgi:anaerobic magnesium-protoporphyrin IX monomethyl ester cyclase